MSDSMSGRVILVTGAATGIGAATAEGLTLRSAVVWGADINFDADRLTGGERRTEHRLHLDIRDEADWERAIARILETEGRLDGLVHAAGISGASPLTETTLGEWRRVLETNLDGTFLAIRHGIRGMRESGGAIVALGSASGIRPSAGAAAYCTSKAGVGMLVRSAAKECREQGLPVRVNAVSPGGVRTPLWRTMPFFQELVLKHGSEEAAFAVMEAHGGGRFADPGEVAEVIAFLLSDAALQINGVELTVDGGFIL